MIKKLLLLNSSGKIYFFSIILSIIFYFPFTKFYINIFHPINFGGSLFLSVPVLFDEILSGMYLSYPLFLALLISVSSINKKKKIWIWGFIFPFSLAIVSGIKDVLWLLIFSAIGFLIGQLIVKMKK